MDTGYDDSYRGARTQQHPRYARPQTAPAGTRKQDPETQKEILGTPPAPVYGPEEFKDAGGKPATGVSFEKADPARAAKRKAGPPASMLK